MALCTTYKFNDKKIYKYLYGYIEKKELEEKLKLVSRRINQWHEQFFDDESLTRKERQEYESRLEKEGEEKSKSDEKPRISSQLRSSRQGNNNVLSLIILIFLEALQGSEVEKRKVIEIPQESKRSFLTRLKINSIKKLIKWRNPFVFASSSELFKEVLVKNKNIIPKEIKELNSYAFKDLNQVAKTIDYIERFYLKFESTSHENLENSER